MLLAVSVAALAVGAAGYCYDNSTPFTLATPLDANGVPMCAPGFHCPNFNASDPSTYPQYCAPDIGCIMDRSFGTKCNPSGNQEPEICLEGFYCPTATDILECPEGHYCTYATYDPIKCPPLSICPAGSAKLLYFGGLVSSFCLLVLLAALVVSYRKWWRYTSLNTAFHEADRFLALGSARPSSSEPEPNGDVSLPYGASIPMSIRKSAIDVLAGGFRRARNTDPLTYEIRDLRVFAPQTGSASRVGMDFSAESRELRRVNSKRRASSKRQAGGAATGKKAKRVPILHGVTAIFAPSRVTAIIGPGGCGKSTLLNAVLGGLPKGWSTEGTISVNGDSSPDVPRRLRRVTGSVTQAEPLHRELTVLQNLEYNAKVRLPSDWSDEDRKFFLAATLEALQLTPQKDMPIGDEESRGISGGQRRRCHIGVEIASAPFSLFLDEPTNGLDSTTALEVCNCLSAIATGADLTVVMAISQPRVEIWDQLHDIIVVGKGGRTVYQGKREDAQSFFEDVLDVSFRANGNPADVIVDAVADRGAELASKWADYCANPQKYARKVRGVVSPASPPPATTDSSAETFEQMPNVVSVPPQSSFTPRTATSGQTHQDPAPVATYSHGGHITINRECAPFWKQVLLIAHRTAAKQLSDLQPVIVEQVVNVAVAAVLGLSVMDYTPYWTFRYYKLLSPPEDDLIPQILMYLCMSLGIVCAMPSCGVFVNSRETYFREAKSGFSKPAYYLGVTLSLQPRVILTAMIFTTLFQLLPQLAVDFGSLFCYVWLVCNGSYAVGAIPAMIFGPASAPLVGSLATILASCLGGFIDFPNVIKYFSYAFWSTSYIQRSFQKPIEHAYEDMGTRFHWISDDAGYCVGMTFLLIVILHGIAYTLMVFMNRDKQR